MSDDGCLVLTHGPASLKGLPQVGDGARADGLDRRRSAAAEDPEDDEHGGRAADGREDAEDD